MAKYEFYLTDDAGRRITLLKNIAFASLSRTIMGYGTFHIGIPFKDFNVFPAFLPDRRVEVWRSPAHGATMRREGSFLLRKYNVYTREEDAVQIIEFYGRSPLDILRRQHVTSTTLANYSKTNMIDDMQKEIVRENFISPVQTAPSGELSCDGDESDGPIVSHTFFAQNVLDILKDLRDMSFSLNKITDTDRRIFFDVVEGSPLSNGGFGYTFRTYADLRGTDRTGGVIFSVENGNMKSPSYFEDYLDSITQASILNLSTPAANGSATSPDATLSRWNTIVGAQQSSEITAALNNAKANALLREQEAEIAFNATFLDSPGSNQQPRSLYGVDWDLGDLLPVQYAGKNFNSEVSTVYLSVNEKGEENIVGLSSPRVVQPAQAEPESPDAEISFLDESSDETDLTTYTFASMNFGVAAAGRYIIVEVIGWAGAARTVTSVTVGGVAATLVKTQANGNARMSMYVALVPTGTTGSVVVVFSGAMVRAGVALWRAININPVAEATGGSTAAPMTADLAVSAGSVQVGCAWTFTNGATATWSGTNGMTEDFDTPFSGSSLSEFTGASRTSPAAVTVTATCTVTTSSSPAYVSASFAKA